MNDFVPFQSFFTEDEATPIMETLKENNIEYKIEKLKEPLGSIIAGEITQDKIFLQIRSTDFQKANEVLDKVILNNIPTLEKDYYLFTFTNNELLEIIQKPDEWSRQDFLIARKILNDRGADLPDEKINAIKTTRIKELAKQESGDSFWIILGYALALLGGIMGFAVGLPFIFAKKTLPDGNRIYIYNKNTRQHGKFIAMLTGIVVAINLFFNDDLKFTFIGFFGYTF
jgi:hypothetical protein